MSSADIAQALTERRAAQPKAADRKRWDSLHASYLAAKQAADTLAVNMRVKYSDKNWRTWSSRSERTKLEKLEAKRDKLGDKIFQLLLHISPRGEAWRTGAPVYWIYNNLSWEDAVRPTGEPLSVVVPAPYGNDRGLT